MNASKNTLGKDSQSQTSKLTTKNGRVIFKAFILTRLHQLFFEKFENKILDYQTNFTMECYDVDNKIIRFIIQDIIETGDYTLEGIAYHTHIPFDIIYDLACGISNQLSVTPWIKIINLYLQVRPEILKILIETLIGDKTTVTAMLQ